MKKLLLVTFSIFLSFTGWSQKIITGVVNDSSGVPLPGAAVIIDGTVDGVATDFDGNYRIEANVGDVLVFSFVGFLTQKVIVGDSDTIDIFIQQDADELKEVVVIAYGTQKRESIAGAVSIIKADQIENLLDLNREMLDRFGNPPPGFIAFTEMHKIRCLAQSKEFISIESKGEKLMCRKKRSQSDPYLKIGNRFPRLTNREPLIKLEEIFNYIESYHLKA